MCPPLFTKRSTARARRAKAARDRGDARQAFLLRLGDAIRPLFDPVRIQAEAMRVLGEHLGASRVHYAGVEDDQNTCHVHPDFQAPGVASIAGVHQLDWYGAFVAGALRAGRTLVVPDTSRVEGVGPEELAAFRAVGVAAFVAVPLVKAGRLVVVLAVHQAVPRKWAPAEVGLIEETAERTWAVVERAHAEQALRESEAKYRFLFDSIDEGFCIVEVLFDGERPIDYVFRELNPAFERHTGLVNATGRRMREIVPGHEEYWFEIYGRVALTGESVRFQKPATALGRFYDVCAFRVGAPEQHLVAMLFDDITEHKLAEERLRESDRRKDEYLAMLGHELRNPLGVIRNATELLKRTEPEDPRLRRVYELLDRQSSHMSRIIDGLLDVSRIAQGKINLELGTIDLREVVERVLDTWTSSITTRGLVLRAAVDPQPLWITGDDARLVQVFDNLVGNAFKFTPAPGTIDVAVQREARCAVIRVRDTGLGIRQAQISSIFEPFEQETQNVARTAGGLGLGLALAKGLVELHHGTIEAHSAGPGTGAELVVRLPLAAAPVEVTEPGREDGDPPRRVLVVEDNVDAAQMLRELLELSGHEVTVAATGHEALEALRSTRVDVVLCDLGIPDMSGYEVARAVRADASLRETPLVALTGYGQPEDRRRTAEAGFDDHLTKPVNLEALHAVFGRLAAADGTARGVS
jgi:signal transduction histidine kinase/ActR/RegA family two-component response regulator